MASEMVREIMEDMRSPLYQNAIYLIINTMMVAGAGFLFWLVVARLYPQEDVGMAWILVGVMTFLTTLSQLGLGVGLIRFLPTTRNNKVRMINSCLTIVVLVSVILAMGVLLTMHLWFPEGAEALSLAVLAPVFILLAFVQAQAPILDNTVIAGRRASYVLVRNAFYQGARLVFPFVFVGLLGVLGILASLAVAHVVALSVVFAFLLPRLLPGFWPNPALDRPVLNDIIHFSLGNHVAEVLHVLPYPVILALIPRLTGSVGLAASFGFPWLIASLLFAVPLMASISLFAEGSHFQEGLRQHLRKTLRFVLPLLVLGILFIWFLGDWILTLVGPTYAEEGLPLLRILAVSGVFVTVNGLFVSVARVMKWVKAVIALWGFVALGTIGLAYVLIPAQGLEGAGMAWLITNAVAAVAVVAAYLLKRGSLRELLAPEARGEVS